MNMPEQNPPGSKKFELRATASGETLDSLLAALTTPAERKSLPGFLYLFGRDPYIHVVDDVFDGQSRKDKIFKAYSRHVTDYVRNKFNLAPEVKHDPMIEGSRLNRIELGVNLGVEAARRLIAPPFFNDADSNDTIIPMVYTIPHPVADQAMVRALGDLRDYVAERPRGVVDELAIVDQNNRERPIILRNRVRKFTPETTSGNQRPSGSPPKTSGSDLQKAS